MVFQKGLPSANPHGRPRVGVSLAYAIRNRFPPERIVDVAEQLTESEDERVRMVALQFLADRGYGKIVNASDPADDNNERIEVDHIPIEEQKQMRAAMVRMAALAIPVEAESDSEH